MTPSQQRRVRDLFEASLDRASGAEQWIAGAAADDEIVRDDVLSLLAHHARAGEFLSQPVADVVPDLLNDTDGLDAGATVGTYTIVREIGRGGMGRVYLATDARLGRTVALKALSPALVGDPAQRERLRREARAAAALVHPGICAVYALEEIDGALFIAGEFVDGRTLRDEIGSGRRPAADDVLRAARDIADAVAAAHASGIVHRDLKPENIMRSRDGRWKILDFGLARSRSDHGDPRLTQPRAVVGTPAYMSPEQVNGGVADARADVFALGVVLYEYASGVHPFGGATPLAIAARVLESDASPLSARCPELSSGLVDVVARCLRKPPDERFASAIEMVGALKSAAGARSAPPHAFWWRVHQLAIVAIGIASAAFAWQLKEWRETPVTVIVFLALGGAATVTAILRGHLVFTERFNPRGLTRERRRTRIAIRVLDLVTAACLAVDAAMIASARALPAVFALSAALGVALASLVVEPATTAAAFGEDHDRD